MDPRRSTLVGEMPFRSTIHRLPMIDRSRFALLLGAGVVVATIIAHALDGPKGYWLPMTVAFVFRPDLGPVMRRAVWRVARDARRRRHRRARGGRGQSAGLPDRLVLRHGRGGPVGRPAQSRADRDGLHAHRLRLRRRTRPRPESVRAAHRRHGDRRGDRARDRLRAVAPAPSCGPVNSWTQVAEAVAEYQRTTPTSDAVIRHSLRAARCVR